MNKIEFSKFPLMFFLIVFVPFLGNSEAETGSEIFSAKLKNILSVFRNWYEQSLFWKSIGQIVGWDQQWPSIRIHIGESTGKQRLFILVPRFFHKADYLQCWPVPESIA